GHPHPGQALVQLLLYGCQAQSALDGGQLESFSPQDALETAQSMAQPGSLDAIIGLFQELEILTPRWSERLAHPAPGPWDRRTLALARYFVRRYWLQAVSDYDLYSRVKFACLACVLIKGLGGDFLSTAQLFSKEIENNADNLDTLLDAAYTHPACT
ncbi:FliB family protein, partial [gut metagenome]